MPESKLRKNWRALRRNALGYVVFVPLLLASATLQAALNWGQDRLNRIGIVGNGKKWQSFLPRQMLGMALNLLGIKIERKGAKISRDMPAILPFNHISRLDGLVVGKEFSNMAFIMQASFFKWPVVGPIFKAFGVIGTNQSQDKKHLDRGGLTEAVNEGKDVGFCPEGIQTPGDRVLEWSAGLMTTLFGMAGTGKNNQPVELLHDDVLLYPTLIRVKSIDGKDVLEKPEEWEPYSYIYDRYKFKNAWLNAICNSLPGRVWTRSQVKEIVLQIDVLEPMSPKGFAEEQGYEDLAATSDEVKETLARDFMNAAQAKVRNIIAPEQKQIQKRKEFVVWWNDGRLRGESPRDLTVSNHSFDI